MRASKARTGRSTGHAWQQALAGIRRAVAVDTRGGNRMRESCMYGSVRGARGNSRPYRDGVEITSQVASGPFATSRALTSQSDFGFGSWAAVRPSGAEGPQHCQYPTTCLLRRGTPRLRANTGNRGSFQRHGDWDSFGVAREHAMKLLYRFTEVLARNPIRAYLPGSISLSIEPPLSAQSLKAPRL